MGLRTHDDREEASYDDMVGYCGPAYVLVTVVGRDTQRISVPMCVDSGSGHSIISTGMYESLKQRCPELEVILPTDSFSSGKLPRSTSFSGHAIEFLGEVTIPFEVRSEEGNCHQYECAFPYFRRTQ